MEERNKLILLYDYYGQLLSDQQQKYFEDYYFTMPRLHEVVGDDVFDWRDIGNTIFDICVTLMVVWIKSY